MNGFKEFLTFVRGRPDVLAELRGAADLDLRAFCEHFVAVGGRYGFQFAAAEVEQSLDDSIVRALRDDNLSDRDLEALSSGGKGTGCASLFTVLVAYLLETVLPH